MKITLNWLKQYVAFTGTPEELSERLTMLGIEVEAVRKLGGEFEGVVVSQILASEKHPNADKLSVCRVADGTGERQIVCGAKNYSVGDKVPLILPGSSLPSKEGQAPITIKAGKIRGVDSQGMLCSPQELGLAELSEGLLILPADAKVGQPFAQHLGRAVGDVLFDLEITPNRPDLNSLIGIAREIGAVTERPLQIPNLPNAIESSGDTAANWVAVRIEDPELCPRYIARVVRGVKIGPSPDWLRSALESVGVRSINNVVDVTNYVMLETGQPLHAFDYHRLHPTIDGDKRPTIVVRRAADGEKFTTHDGTERTFSSQMLLIGDGSRAVALAGIMGGQNTEISDSTCDVLLESAYFKPQSIRATSKKLELRSESSYRFERGADLGITDWASRRALQLILETAGGTAVPESVDAYPLPNARAEIPLRHAKVHELLGIEIPAPEQIRFLQRLELQLVGAEHGIFNTFRIPSFRVDLKREIDLIEEIARLYGVERIPATPPRGAIGTNPYDLVHDQLAEVRRILSGLGLCEAQGQTLISDRAATCGRAVGEGELVPLANPLSSDMNVLRPSLIPGLLETLRHNAHHKNNDLAVFEIGRVFAFHDGANREQRRLAIALTGRRYPSFWCGDDREATIDSYDLKGILEEFLELFGLRGVTYQRLAATSTFHLEAATLALGHQVLGELGQLSPILAKEYDLRDAVLIAELNLDQLLARRNSAKTFKPLPVFPAIQRDIAMLLPEETTHDSVLTAVRQAKPENLETVELFDVYRGENVPEGQKSVAYSFTYRRPDRTLTDTEINTTHEKLTVALRDKLKATLRA